MSVKKITATHGLAAYIFPALAILCLSPAVTPPVALFLGVITAHTIGNPYTVFTTKATHWLLQGAVICLGFGMNAATAWQAGQQGFGLTFASICGTLAAGWLLGKCLRADNVISCLISCGTAICGGSAIAAIAPVVKAGERPVAIALGTVFLLNAAALFIFPPIGHWLDLSQTQFGLWSAIAIHDTSAVVGAASKYGPEALQIATTVKLARALWIIPVAIAIAWQQKTGAGNVKIPWFIAGFLGAILLNTCLPQLQPAVPYLHHAAHSALALTLFFIGTQLSLPQLRLAGWQPLLQGILLWILISTASLITILQFS
ncbi:putative sulfate exporter family transporter [Chitinophaga pendula]|uniref:YeiH family protein n=1 Tax=Chitinophaga TaxID=79328 RepID=UPI000BB013F5|nr:MULTISPECIES: putative sulfate exporter family transporter [Chitinophaga]ASZ14378.1 putative sulfate exporter family transporter [Chitinophaga sp. MD30]UCJ07970.1 putative sulfate exporter family transporter [Chitinophaga pendula]